MARELLIRDNSSDILTNGTWITESWQFKWHNNQWHVNYWFVTVQVAY